MDLVLVLVEIIFGHQVLKWLVWGKTDLCGAEGGSASSREVSSRWWQKGRVGNERNSVARERTRSTLGRGRRGGAWYGGTESRNHNCWKLLLREA